VTGTTILRVVTLAAALGLVGPAVASNSRSAAGSDFFKKLKVGQAVTLRGGDFGGARIRLELVKVADPVRSPYYRSRKGTRFVAFQLRYTNVGKQRYQDVPAAQVELIDSFGSLYDSTSSLYGRVIQPWPLLRPDLNHGLTVDPGETRTAWMGWILPAKMRLRALRYVLMWGSSGAAWTLG
jgi:hypothetical protein